jgi:hypothetical protein
MHDRGLPDLGAQLLIGRSHDAGGLLLGLLADKARTFL